LSSAIKGSNKTLEPCPVYVQSFEVYRLSNLFVLSAGIAIRSAAGESHFLLQECLYKTCTT